MTLEQLKAKRAQLINDYDAYGRNIDWGNPESVSSVAKAQAPIIEQIQQIDIQIEALEKEMKIELPTIDETIVEELASVSSQIKELQATEKALKQVLLDQMDSASMTKVSVGSVTVSKAVRKIYTYSQDLREAEAIIKARKKEEEANGQASFKTSEYLSVRMK